MGSIGKRAGANGESDREAPAGTAPAAVEREPAREHEARESGYGFPGRECSGGKLQGRERHERRPRSVGGHGERRDPKGLERAASQPEPSRGARTLRTAPVRVWRSSPPTSLRKEARGGKARGTRRRSVRGSKNPTRGESRKAPERFGSFLKGPRRRRARGLEAKLRALERYQTPRGKIVGLTFHDKVRRGKPRGRHERRGGCAGSQQGATRRTLQDPAGDGNLKRVGPSAGDRARLRAASSK